jgi:hypothetical protein
MMHSSNADTDLMRQESISNSATIASVGKHAGAGRTKTMLEDGMSSQDPGWFKIVSDRHPPTSSRLELESASVGNLVWYSTTMHPTTAAFIEEQQAHRIKYVIPDLSVQINVWTCSKASSELDLG